MTPHKMTTMSDDSNQHKGRVIGPDGRVLSVDSLPSPETVRWVARRKAEVVASVKGGLLCLNEACARYGLTHDEYFEWERAYVASGLTGLHFRSKCRSHLKANVLCEEVQAKKTKGLKAGW